AKTGIEKLFEKFFGAYSFGKDLKAKLLRYDSVTPGDFGTLAGKIRFMPKSEISSELIIDELCKIQEEKDGFTRHIGFAG
ncbi:MAG: ATP-binding protein, partial [Treponema sp.]|nr:ATP-binding protein [Treponema sp.]